jgi:hypothetical protein
MRIPKLTDAITRITAGTSATPDVTYRVTGKHIMVVQLEASASAAGTVSILGSIDQDEDSAVFPIVESVGVSASSVHLRWFADMPLHLIRISLGGVVAGTVTVKTTEADF